MSLANGLGPRLDETSAVWKQLTEQIESFLAAWKTGAPPSLADFVPACDAALRRLFVAELVKVDLEQRWGAGQDPKLLETYAIEFPELSECQGPAADLIYEEYHIRRQSGQNVSSEEYFQRFPNRVEELRRLLGLEAADLSTALFSGRSLPEEIAAGRQLEDFDLLLQLGQGAFSKVFLARQRSLQRLVALKVSEDKGREPETLAQLDHPYIVRVFDQRRLADQGLRLLYMQYISGGTIADVLARLRDAGDYDCSGRRFLSAIDEGLVNRGESPPDISELRDRLAQRTGCELVVELGLRLSEALDYAHRRGVLHRDIKPANIMVTAEGAPMLVDFNVSFCDQLEGATPAAYFGGSLAYMAPEQLDACNPRTQIDASALDGRSDIYSLGVVLFELVTGQRPFPSEHLCDSWSDTLTTMAARRRYGLESDSLSTDFPTAFRDVLYRALAPEPDDRFATAGEMAAAMRLCLEPEVQDLLQQEQTDWRATVRREFTPTVVAMIVLPNAAAGTFNFAYNFNWLTSLYPGTESTFRQVSNAINTVAFSLGIIVGLVVLWPIVRAVREYRRNGPKGTSGSWALRRRCLRFSHYAALIGIAEWSVAGSLFPIVLETLGVPLTPLDYVHFCASLLLCGLIAASYPFFLVTFILLRSVYPILLRPDSLTRDDGLELARLARRSRPYLHLAAALPLLGVLLLVVVEQLGGQKLPIALLVLSAGGVMALGPILWLSQRIAHDVDLLQRGVELLGAFKTSRR